MLKKIFFTLLLFSTIISSCKKDSTSKKGLVFKVSSPSTINVTISISRESTNTEIAYVTANDIVNPYTYTNTDILPGDLVSINVTSSQKMAKIDGKLTINGVQHDDMTYNGSPVGGGGSYASWEATVQ